MHATFEQASDAKTTVRARLGRPTWLRGVGIGRDDDGHFVKINVDVVTPEVERAVPSEVSGVRVRVEAVGDISASMEGRQIK